MYPWGVDYDLALGYAYLVEVASRGEDAPDTADQLADQAEMPPLSQVMFESCVASLLLLAGIGATISVLVGPIALVWWVTR